MVGQKKQDMSEYKLIHLGEITVSQTLNSSKWVSECADCCTSVCKEKADTTSRMNGSGNQLEDVLGEKTVGVWHLYIIATISGTASSLNT